MRIGDRDIGPMHPPAVLAEFGMCHEGDIDKAIEMLDVALESGAWGIKLQLLDPETIAAAEAPKYWEHGDGRSQREVFADNGPPLSWEHLKSLRGEARHCGMAFGATPFDLRYVTQCVDLDVDYVKVASGDITNRPLIEAIRDTGIPVIMSTGAARMGEIDRAVKWLAGSDLCLLACSLEYPTPPERAALGRIKRLAFNWAAEHVSVGYSDHTLGSWCAAPAVAAGACLLEKHFSLGGKLPVPDHEMAIGGQELLLYCEDARRAWDACSISKLQPHPGEMPARSGARRCWYARRDLPAGTVLSAADVALLRPHVPFSVDGTTDVATVTITRPVSAGDPVLWSHAK